jgi:hypothetical protein
MRFDIAYVVFGPDECRERRNRPLFHSFRHFVGQHDSILYLRMFEHVRLRVRARSCGSPWCTKRTQAVAAAKK